MCQHPACAAETRIRSKDCDVTIADRMGSRDAFPIPFPSFIYARPKIFSCVMSKSVRESIRLHIVCPLDVPQN